MATSHISPSFQYLEHRLEVWADWYGRLDDNCLGYPNCTIEYRIMREGILTKTTGPKIPPMNEAAEEMESWIIELSNFNKHYANAIRDKYITQALDPYIVSIDTKLCLKHGVSARRFREWVQSAKIWLAGRMQQK